MFLAAPQRFILEGNTEQKLALKTLDGIPLLLPGHGYFLRKLIDNSLNRTKVEPYVISEVESTAAPAAAVKAGLGATLLPASASRSSGNFANALVRVLVKPASEATVSFCVCDRLPLSDPALATRCIVLDAIMQRWNPARQPSILFVETSPEILHRRSNPAQTCFVMLPPRKYPQTAGERL